MSDLDPKLNICPKCGQWIAVDSSGLTATEIAKIKIAQLEAELEQYDPDYRKTVQKLVATQRLLQQAQAEQDTLPDVIRERLRQQNVTITQLIEERDALVRENKFLRANCSKSVLRRMEHQLGGEDEI